MRRTTTLLFLGILLTGCIDDAPHDNPLDPESAGYVNEGNLTGRIIIANQSEGVPGAFVWNSTEGIGTTTDTSGNFSFAKLSEGEHRCIVSAEKYANDTFIVTIRPKTTAQVVRGLNAAPVVTFQQILSRKIDYIDYSPRYFVDIVATVTDPNSIYDPDSAWFNVTTYSFPLTYSTLSKNFTVTLEKDSFPTNTIDWLVGKPLHIIAKDIHNSFSVSESFFVTRVIENSSVPVDQDTTSATPLFSWTPPNVNYEYTNTVTVYRAGTETVVWTYSGLIPFFEELQYPSNGSAPTLTKGNYFWTITLVDKFGNYSRSRESYFVVQ
ncbi:MAG: carboxypeptidase-like regulatory domain-containing protein [Bacteroidota bacterium]